MFDPSSAPKSGGAKHLQHTRVIKLGENFFSSTYIAHLNFGVCEHSHLPRSQESITELQLSIDIVFVTAEVLGEFL